MATPKYAVGCVVEHPVKPDWGRGRVEAVETPRILVRWMGAGATPRWMWTDAVPLPLSADQTEPFPGRSHAKASAGPKTRPRAAAAAPKNTYKGGHSEAPPADAE